MEKTSIPSIFKNINSGMYTVALSQLFNSLSDFECIESLLNLLNESHHSAETTTMSNKVKKYLYNKTESNRNELEKLLKDLSTNQVTGYGPAIVSSVKREIVISVLRDTRPPATLCAAKLFFIVGDDSVICPKVKKFAVDVLKRKSKNKKLIEILYG